MVSYRHCYAILLQHNASQQSTQHRRHSCHTLLNPLQDALRPNSKFSLFTAEEPTVHIMQVCRGEHVTSRKDELVSIEILNVIECKSL